ncbi:MAG: hypothetical protein JRC90_10485 [Deltaproteobacteria bacterium]|nr:hypothetical protein [Deltaproteobacteria bacterium]
MRVSRLDKEVSWEQQDYGGKRPGKSVCVQRYGGFGDMLQVSSILPGLKDQGFYVTVNTDTVGFDIIKNDPYVDEIFVQEHGQVENSKLGEYWERLSKCFDKFIMLSESVERTLLALPELRESTWHPDFRRMVMGTVDYLEATHAIAEVPLPPRVRFYPTDEERKWSNGFRKSLGKNTFVLMWALSGSSVHKTWPYLDIIIARLLSTFPNVKIVTCGDSLSKVLECGWEKESRVITKSGEWSIRKTLAFAERCDFVVGPETGILNAVSMLSIPKILMLSHSSPMNIGKNWINAFILTPEKTPCYPCHILHRGFDLCCRDDITGTAMCAANISVEKVWNILFEKIKGVGNEHVSRPMSEVS